MRPQNSSMASSDAHIAYLLDIDYDILPHLLCALARAGGKPECRRELHYAAM